MARGVAFQLVEALGVLERQKVAEEVKGLDQPSRATLRKYGVRFGAYHIYLPLLLKPAPRALATQLWALKHESPDAKGVPELLHLAASRTHLDPARQGDAEGALPHRRLSRLPASARCASTSWSGSPTSFARRCPGAKASTGAEAGWRVRRPRLYRHRRDDLADRRVGRRLCLDPALARLSHGPPAETARGARGRDACGMPATRRRLKAAAATAEAAAGEAAAQTAQATVAEGAPPTTEAAAAETTSSAPAPEVVAEAPAIAEPDAAPLPDSELMPMPASRSSQNLRRSRRPRQSASRRRPKRLLSLPPETERPPEQSAATTIRARFCDCSRTCRAGERRSSDIVCRTGGAGDDRSLASGRARRAPSAQARAVRRRRPQAATAEPRPKRCRRPPLPHRGNR